LSDSKKRRRKDFEATSLNLLAPNAARRASIEGVVATEAGTRAGPASRLVQRRAARPEGPPREERRAVSLSCWRVFFFYFLEVEVEEGLGSGQVGEKSSPPLTLLYVFFLLVLSLSPPLSLLLLP